MEYFDIVDINRNKTNKFKIRSKKINRTRWNNTKSRKTDKSK